MSLSTIYLQSLIKSLDVLVSWYTIMDAHIERGGGGKVRAGERDGVCCIPFIDYRIMAFFLID